MMADRKRLKRSLTSWRVLAILALLVAAVVAAQAMNATGTSGSLGGDYIAQITIDGVMGDNKERNELLDKIRDDKHAKALLVQMDSPGGTTFGGEELYLKFREIGKKKPVVGVMRTLCASACYMASLGTDHVVAREGTLTGSIGVLLQSVEVSRLAEKLGITPITIKSGRYKDAPSFTEPFADDQRAVVREVVNDAYEHFTGMIIERRKMTPEQVAKLADGRVYTGRQAAQLDLIDGLGGKDEALAWLAAQRKVNPKLELKEMDAKPKYESLFSRLSQWTGIKIFNNSSVGLDGLISIWQHPAM
jgi:protease-4